MSDETRFKLNLVGLLFVILVWLGGTVACVFYACQPGNAPAILGALLTACVGYGFFREAVEQVGRSLDRCPVRN